jgi:sarcosine oxidase subunit alpha
MIDVMIAGAGPAGLSAAIACAEHGLRVQVIDEFLKPGGRLLGQLHQEPDGTWWNGIQEADKLYTKAKSLSVDVQCKASIYDIEHDATGWTIYTTNKTFRASSLLLATGAAELSVPIPGWTLPGVMSIGAAQVMANVHRVKPGQKGVIVGINVLSVAIARELQLAGIEIDSLVLPEMNPLTEKEGHPEEIMKAMSRLAHLAPSALIRFGSKLLKGRTMEQLGVKFYPKKGMKIWGMPVRLRTAALEIYGEKQVEGIRLADIRPSGEVIFGTERTVPVDFVCIAGGLYPLAELAAIGGCSFQWIPSLGGHVPVHN